MSNKKKNIITFGGGVGAGKFLRGLYNFRSEYILKFVVNTSDDIDIYDVRVSPDVDSVLYWISGIIDRERGWGIKEDTFKMVRSDKSNWFNLGDRDFEYNKRKKLQLDSGITLSETINIRKDELKINNVEIFPMTNDKVETYLETDAGLLHIQEYLIKHKMSPGIKDIKFVDAEDAELYGPIKDALVSSDLIIFCPSNPLISVEPILRLKGLQLMINSSNAIKVAISPIVNGFAFQGPILNLLKLKNLDCSVIGIAEYYKDFIDYLVIDNSDRIYEDKINKMGIKTLIQEIKIKDDDISTQLASSIIKIL
tara:strand:+ start:11340 stop:12269 length:930 start_codon:yes stop_codon:yes gene_type:complete